MKIILNGNEIEAKTLSQILSNFGKNIALVINGEIAPKSTWASLDLNEGDRLEIIELVGGG